MSISDIAMGIDPVAHTYIGTATATITSMASRGYSARLRKSESGTATVITAATTSPITSHLPTDATISVRPYFTAAHILLMKPRGASASAALWQQPSLQAVADAVTGMSLSPSLSLRSTAIPPATEPTSAAMGLTMANGRPSRA